MDGTQRCPHCGKEILALAIKCRYCGEWLIDTSQFLKSKPALAKDSLSVDVSQSLVEVRPSAKGSKSLEMVASKKDVERRVAFEKKKTPITQATPQKTVTPAPTVEQETKAAEQVSIKPDVGKPVIATPKQENDIGYINMIQELKGVGETLISQMKEVAKLTGDTVYAQMGQHISDMADVATEATTGRASSKTKNEIALDDVAIDSAARSGKRFQDIRNDRVLLAKRDYASVKKPVLERVMSDNTQLEERIKTMLLEAGSQHHSLDDLGQENNLKRLANSIGKHLYWYRVAECIHQYGSYMLDEYGAWLKGEYKSNSLPSPYYQMNERIVKMMEEHSGENAYDVLIKTLANSPQTISGSFIYYIIDPTLTSTIIFSHPDTFKKFHPLVLPENRCLRNLTWGNSILVKYVRLKEEYEKKLKEWEEGKAEAPEKTENPEDTAGCCITLVVMFVVGIAMYWFDCSWWLIIVAEVVIVLIDFYIIGSKSGTGEVDNKPSRTENLKMANRELDSATGYVYRKMHKERKNGALDNAPSSKS